MNRQCLAVFAASFAVAAGTGSPPDVLRSPDTERALAHPFSPEDERLLDEVQRGCFAFFWREVEPPALLARDRLKSPVSSVAAVGFQLSALPIGVQRGWITREQGERRALAILDALLGREDNKKHGIYLHFVDRRTGGLSKTAYEVLASTVDSALLIAGALPAAQYFGGAVSERIERMVRGADWQVFVKPPDGYICMGWRPNDRTRMDGDGEFHHALWSIASAEEQLVYWLAVGSPVGEHAVAPQAYYALRREIGRHADMPPFVMSWSGTLFHFFFSQCWIDYRSLQADDPAAFGVDGPRVDWFENSRRAVLTHRRRCVAARDRFGTFRENIWGLSACTGSDSYLVPHVQPNMCKEDRWCAGTVAPYAAASSIMFAPREAMAAIRAMRELRGSNGKPLAWRAPADGGFGFVDAFNVDQSFASDDYVGIDHGPMLLAIENARTGLIWRLFMSHPVSRLAVERLQLTKRGAG